MGATIFRNKFKRGERIITKGEAAAAAYAVISGTVRVFLEKDQKHVTLAELGPGAIFGETALFGGTEYGANVEAATDAELSVITPEGYREKIAACDPIIREIISMLLERQKKTNEALLNSETREFVEIAFV